MPPSRPRPQQLQSCLLKELRKICKRCERVTDCCGPTLGTTSKLASFLSTVTRRCVRFGQPKVLRGRSRPGAQEVSPAPPKGRYHFSFSSPFKLVSSRLGEPRVFRQKNQRFPFIVKKKNRTTLSELRDQRSGPEIVPTSHRDSHRRALDGSLPHPSRRFRRRNGPFFGWPRPPVGKKLFSAFGGRRWEGQ